MVATRPGADYVAPGKNCNAIYLVAAMAVTIHSAPPLPPPDPKYPIARLSAFLYKSLGEKRARRREEKARIAIANDRQINLTTKADLLSAMPALLSQTI
jgi:hypothetical protein